MKTITLSDELDLDSSLLVDIFDYQTSQEISKQQIILSKNTFSFLSEGTKEVFFDNSSYAIDNSKFLLMKSGHCLMTEKLSNAHSYKSFLFFFSNEMVFNFIRKFEFNFTTPQHSNSVSSFQYDTFIKKFVESLIEISKLSKNVQQKLLVLKFEEIMLYLTELHGLHFLFSLINNSDDQMQNFTRTIESNQLKRLTLKELSFLCNMSLSSFKREFIKHYHESPIKWFQDKRLEYASHLLKNEQKRPSDIFMEVGYENLSSFIQAYKIKYGVTPKQHYKE